MGTTERKWIEQWLTGVSPEGLKGEKVHGVHCAVWGDFRILSRINTGEIVADPD